jgi:bifunctional non-homologous end joining protein LigD
MLATSGPLPSGPGWALEVKFDGVRAIGYAGPGGLVLYSRNDRDISRCYPEVAALDLEAGLVVDGELVALDGRGRPDFGLLQQRMHVAKPAADLIFRVAVQYVVFDVLRRDDRSLLAQPYQDRRAVLGGLGLGERGLVVPGNFTETPGAVVMAAVAQQGLEGVVAKRLTSPYQPGVRSRSWIKTPIRHSAEVIIAGWALSSGNAGVLGALLLAAYGPDGELVYVGDVGDRVHRRRPPPSAGAVAAVAARGSTARGGVRAGPRLAGTPPGQERRALGAAQVGRGGRVSGVHP